LCHADGRTDGRMDMKQTFAFRNFAYPPECDSRATLRHLYVRTCRSFRNFVITGSMNSVSYFGPFHYPRPWTDTRLTSVTQLPDIAGLCNCMLAFLRLLYGVPRQCCLKGTPCLRCVRRSLVEESKQLCLCVR